MTGRRERRKEESRRAISAVATRLFEERGFEQVTIVEIADAADVARKTVTNYFPRKEDLVFDRAQDTINSLAVAAAMRQPGVSILAAVRADCERRIVSNDPTIGVPTRELAELVWNSHVLMARFREIEELSERALGDALAVEFDADTPEQRLVAGLLAAVPRTLFAEGTRQVLAGRPRAEVFTRLAALTDWGFRQLEPALGDYGRRHT